MSSELTVASAAPIIGSSRTDDYHMDAARTESEQVALTAGTGSAVFLMTRSWSPPLARSGAPAEMMLRRTDGTTVAELRNLGTEVGSGADPARGATIVVDPGAYVMDWYDYDAAVGAEQAVYAVVDWQTQVFLLREPDEDRGGHYSVSMLMTRSGCYPDDSIARTVEVARSALAEERSVASSMINESLFAKFENPMLGLFGAHLMLLSRDAERKAAAEERRSTSKRRPRAGAAPSGAVR
jgi:hypothetical protein